MKMSRSQIARLPSDQNSFCACSAQNVMMCLFSVSRSLCVARDNALFLLGSLADFLSNLIAEPPLLIVVFRHYPFKLQPEHLFLQTRLLLLDRARRAWSQHRSDA